MAEYLREVEKVIHKLFHMTDDGWRNDWCERQIERMHVAAEVARENGKKGGRPPKGAGKTQKKPRNNPAGSQQDPNGLPTGTQQEPAGNPTATQQKATQDPRPNTQDYSVPNGTDADASHRDADRDLPADWDHDGPPPRDLRDEDFVDAGQPAGDLFSPPDRFPPTPTDEPEETPSARIWAIALPYLKEVGIAERPARRLIGSWVSGAQGNHVELLRSVEAMVRSGTKDPAGYIGGATANAHGRRFTRRGRSPGDISGIDYTLPPNLDTSENFG